MREAMAVEDIAAMPPSARPALPRQSEQERAGQGNQHGAGDLRAPDAETPRDASSAACSG